MIPGIQRWENKVTSLRVRYDEEVGHALKLALLVGMLPTEFQEMIMQNGALMSQMEGRGLTYEKAKDHRKLRDATNASTREMREPGWRLVHQRVTIENGTSTCEWCSKKGPWCPVPVVRLSSVMEVMMYFLYNNKVRDLRLCSDL